MPEKAFSVCIKDSVFIDPPYNTGNDFLYEDDFDQRMKEYFVNSGQVDGEGNRMVQNTESNGRFYLPHWDVTAKELNPIGKD